MNETNETVPKISMSNTKKEMLEAYNTILKQLQKKKEEELNPFEKKEEKQKKELIKIADSLSLDGVYKNIGDFKTEIINWLSKISDKLEEELKNYVQIKEAIKIKENELKEIYEIDREAQTLVSLIEAQNLKKEEFEKQMSDRKRVVDDEINQTKELWEKEKKAYEMKLKEEKEIEERRKKREEEEFRYIWNRQAQIEKDKIEYEKTKLKKELDEMKESVEKELKEREMSISKQEEEELKNLRQKVESFPKELEAAVNKAIKDCSEKFKIEKKKDEDILNQLFEAERQALNTKIESLTKTIEEQNKQIIRLSGQLDSAYQKIQNIAVKTIGNIHENIPPQAVIK